MNPATGIKTADRSRSTYLFCVDSILHQSLYHPPHSSSPPPPPPSSCCCHHPPRRPLLADYPPLSPCPHRQPRAASRKRSRSPENPRLVGPAPALKQPKRPVHSPDTPPSDGARGHLLLHPPARALKYSGVTQHKRTKKFDAQYWNPLKQRQVNAFIRVCE